MAETLIQTPNPKPRPEEDTRPPSEEALALALALVRQYRGSCFWFWRRDPRLETRADVYAVIHGLREYGDRKAWKEAQQLWQCL